MKHELQRYLTSLHQHPTSATLASLVRELFPAEIAKQQQLACEMMQTRNYIDPEPPEASTNTHATSSNGATSIEVSHIDTLTHEFAQRHHVALRSMLVVLFASVAVASFCVFYFLAPLNRQSTPSSANKSSARAMPVSADVILGPVSIEDNKSAPELATGVDVSPDPSASATTTFSRNVPGAPRNPAAQWHWAAGAPSAGAPNAVRKLAKQKTLPPTRNYGI